MSTDREAAETALKGRVAASASASPVRPPDKEFMLTLAKGLAVLGAFGRGRPTMTLSEAAAVADLSRATARRVLRTLTALGYVRQDGRRFALTPRILDLGFAYLAAENWVDRALPQMRALSEKLRESCSASILQGSEVVYVARVPTRRIMSATLTVGSRLPAFHTSMGRVQLGFLDEEEIWRRLMALRIEAPTPSTITDREALFDRIVADHKQGFSIVDEELERGLRSVAVPVLDRGGEARGAINLSTHSARTTRNEMRARFLPELKAIAADLAASAA